MIYVVNPTTTLFEPTAPPPVTGCDVLRQEKYIWHWKRTEINVAKILISNTSVPGTNVASNVSSDPTSVYTK